MTWALRIEAESRIGTGAVITPTLVLTCEHVVKSAPTVGVRSPSGEARPFKVIDKDEKLDIALLEVDVEKADLREGEPILAEGSVLIPRALERGRRPTNRETFVELCTDEAETPRSLEIELRPPPPDSPRVQFVVPGGREGVRRSYSGGPVVEIDERWDTPRLLGIVRARDETSVDALNNAGAGWFVPTERIAARFAQIASRVETPVERGPAWEQHWEPRSRGVATSDDAGFFFSGRVEAYERVRRHLEEGSGLLIVTGLRGRGKSAVLAHIVALGCPRYLTLLGDEATIATRGYTPLTEPVDAAVLARDKTAEAVAAEVAEQLDLPPSTPEELLAAIGSDQRLIVIDAVDESDDPDALMRTVVAPLAQRRARIAIGALRRRINVLDVPAQPEWVDLNHDDYRDDEALPSYVARRLRQVGGYEKIAAETVANEVAKRAKGIFLVAELVARTLEQREPIDTDAPSWEKQLPGDLTEAFRDYLGRFKNRSRRVLALLHPLAHARGNGLTSNPGDVWLAAANALRPGDLDPFAADDLTDTRRRAADYLITRREDDAARLYHEGLADAIRRLAAREQLNRVDQEVTPDTVKHEMDNASRVFLDALVGLLPESDDAAAAAYEASDPYLLRQLPSHLADHGRLEELLDRPGLLVAADQIALRGAFVRGASALPRSRSNARVAIVHALARTQPGMAEQAGALAVALRRQDEGGLAERVEAAYVSAKSRHLPYELISAPPLAPALATIPEAHTDWILALLVVEHDGQPLIISASGDGAIRSWQLDGRPGPLGIPDAHAVPESISARRRTGALVVLEHGRQPLLISAGNDGAIRSWRLDGRPGPLTLLDAHTGPIGALALADHEGEPLLLSGADDGALRSWRLDGQPGPLVVQDAHAGSIRALAVVEHDAQPLLISAGGDPAIQTWRLDGEPGPLTVAAAHSGPIRLAVAEHGGEPLLLSAGGDSIRSWRLDGQPGPLTLPKAHGDWNVILALALVEHNGQPLLLSADRKGAIQSWRLDGQPGPFTMPDAHTSWILALEAAEQDGEPLLISAGRDRAIKTWQLDRPPGPLTAPAAHSGPIRALAVVKHDGQPLLLSAGGVPSSVVRPPKPTDRAIRSWRLDGRAGPLTLSEPTSGGWGAGALAVAEYDGQQLVFSADYSVIRSWWLDGQPGPVARFDTRYGPIAALVVVEHDDQPLLLSAGGDSRTIRSWRFDGQPGPLVVLDAHTGPIAALAVVEYDGQPLLVSAGRDRAIRSWRLDGQPATLTLTDAHSDWIRALVVVEDDGQPFLLSAGDDRAIRSWRLDGRPEPLTLPHAHTDAIQALAVAEQDGQPLFLSAGDDGVILAHRVSP
jgi:WD40 repeat protein/plasmid stabilization system protein ParE